MNYILPFLIILSIINRDFSNLFFIILGVFGSLHVLKKRINKYTIIWILLISFQLLVIILNDYYPTSIKTFYLEGKYLLIYPAGIILKDLCKKYTGFYSYKIYKLLLIFIGIYMLIFSGFSLRFNGGGDLPIIDYIWIPTYSLSIMNVLLQGSYKFKSIIDSSLAILFSISAVVSNSLSVLFVILKKTILNDLKFLFLKLKLKKKFFLILPFLILALIYIFYIFYWRRSGDIVKGLVNNEVQIFLYIDRVAFYYSYIKSYLIPINDWSNLLNLFQGNGIGTPVDIWIQNLPTRFLNANQNFSIYIANSALLFQIEFIRALYSYGFSGIIMILFLLKGLFTNSFYRINKAGVKLNYNKLVINQNLIWAIFITTILTINLSSTANFLSLVFTVYTYERDKEIKN